MPPVMATRGLAARRVNIPMFPHTQERELSDEDIKDISAYIAGIELSNKMATYTGSEDALISC